MIDINLNRNNIVFAILLTLVLAIILVYLKNNKEGFIFNVKYLETSCPKKKKKIIPRINLDIFVPTCKDIIIPTKNNTQQKEYVNNITQNVNFPEEKIEEITTVMPPELLPFKEDIVKITKLSVVKSLYNKEDDIKKNLEVIIANTLYDVEKPELIKKAPYIKKFLESTQIQDIINPIREDIEEEKKEEIIQDIIKNEELINKPTIILTPEEEAGVRTSFTKFSQRCGISLI